RLTTDSAAIYSGLTSQTFDYTNGPPGETSYSNHTLYLNYNSDWSGSKVTAGEVNLGLAFEPKFSQGGGAFQTEWYFTWTNPGNTLTVRPWGFVTAHASGDSVFSIQGKQSFFRHASLGG